MSYEIRNRLEFFTYIYPRFGLSSDVRRCINVVSQYGEKAQKKKNGRHSNRKVRREISSSSIGFKRSTSGNTETSGNR